MSIAKNVGKIIGKGQDAIGASGSKIMKSAASMEQKFKLKEKAKPFVDKKEKDGSIKKSWDTLYTGKKLNPLYTTVGVGAIAAMTATQIHVGKSMAPITSSMKNVEHIGSPEIMLYDGVGQQSAPNHLNANGNLVFGLHNQRRG